MCNGIKEVSTLESTNIANRIDFKSLFIFVSTLDLDIMLDPILSLVYEKTSYCECFIFNEIYNLEN